MTFSGWVNSSRFNKLSNFWIHNELCLISWDNCFGIWSVEEICIGSIFLGHKRRYHTHSDVIFGWVASICQSISDFFAEYLDFVFTMVAAPVWFFNFTTHHENNVKILSKKVEILSQIYATQPKITWVCVW